MAHTQRYFDLFDSPAHRAWKRDRRLRNRIPIEHGDRRCVGLAALFDGRPEDYLHHGLRVLARNHHVRWLALRDVPPGHFPSSPAMNRRPVSWATLCRAQLRHGMPALDFARPLRPGWDFRAFPGRRSARAGTGRPGPGHARPGPVPAGVRDPQRPE
jgi:hypothetical protein